MGHLTDRVIVVTGAGRGLGRAYAQCAARAGARVVVNDIGADITGRNPTPIVEGVVASIVADGGIAVGDEHDVATEGEAIIQTAVDHFGRIDGLVNNAGIVILTPLEELEPDEVNRMLGVHVRGAIATTRAAWPVMREQGFGRIVNVTSAAMFGAAGAPMYPTAKGAIIGFTRSLACDGASSDIKVNAVMPMGYSRMVETQPALAEFMKANFPPESVAPFVCAMLSPEVPCTGEIFAVAGRRAARVFLGTVPGLVGFTSIEDCLERFDEAMALEDLIVPRTMDEEVAFEYQNLGIDLAQLADLSTLGTANG